MAVLQTADGKFLSRRTTLPASPWVQLGVSDPLWTDVDADDDTRRVSYQQVYSEQPWVAAAVNKLAKQISTLPLKVYKRVSDTEREQQRDHPLARLLRSPTPRRSSFHTKWWLIFDVLVHGNALVAKVRDGPDQPPMFLYPLDWTQVDAYGFQGQFVDWWATNQFGTLRVVKAEDTIHVAWPSPDGEIGLSPLQQLTTTVQLEDAGRRQQKAWFSNGVRPSIVLSPGEGLIGKGKDWLEWQQQKLSEDHGTPDNKAKALVVAPGTKVSTVSMTSAEAQLVEARYINRDDVAAVFDIPPPLLGDLRHATLANVSEYRSMLYKDVLRPWLDLVEETIQSQLIDTEPAWANDDLYVKFDLADQLKGDPKDLAETLEREVSSGLMTRNEARALLELPPIGDGKDEENPANQLTVNVNNVGLLDSLNDPQPVLPAQTSLPVDPQPPSPSQA